MNAPAASLYQMVSQFEDRTADAPVSALFLSRWSPRAMTAEPVPDEVLSALFEAARYAPSSYNSQPWRFTYARRGTPEFEAYVASLAETNQVWATEASALILIASKAEFVPHGADKPKVSGSASFDTGAAWASLAFQAALLGWTTRAIGGFDRNKARAASKAPEGLKLEAIVALGRRGDAASLPHDKQALEKPNARRPAAKTVFAGVFPAEV